MLLTEDFKTAGMKYFITRSISSLVSDSETKIHGRPVTWSIDFPRVRDHLFGSITVLAVAPRLLWTWFVLVQPLIALAVAPWYGSIALAAFSVVAIVPATVAWWVAVRQRNFRYSVSPTRSTLNIHHLRDGPATVGTASDDVISLQEVDEITAVPLREFIAVRFRHTEPRQIARFSHRIVIVPTNRWPAFVAALDRAGVAIPVAETEDWRPSLTLVGIIAISALVPLAGFVIGAVIGVQWLLYL